VSPTSGERVGGEHVDDRDCANIQNPRLRRGVWKKRQLGDDANGETARVTLQALRGGTGERAAMVSDRGELGDAWGE
jgi:hypothetical protein